MLTKFAVIALFLLAPALAAAQQGIPRVGILTPDLDRPQSQAIKGLRDALKEKGYQEKKNILFEARNAKGVRASLDPTAAELISQKVDVIVTTGTRATQITKSATAAIPVVFIHPGDPVALQLVKSMEASGSNLTGVAGLALKVTDVRLKILKEIVPALQRVYIFYDANDRFSRENFAFVKKVVEDARLQVVERAVKTSEELKATFGGLQTQAGEAMFHIPDNLVESDADFVLTSARQKKLPTMFTEESWAIKGALAAYGPSYYQMGRQAGGLVDLLIKGRKPETLPIQRAEKFDLILNYRTATFIGLKFSPESLKRADKVIR